MVNLRGGVCTVIDLAAFLGLRDGASAQGSNPAPGQAPGQPRLVAFNAALDINAAVLVDRLEGLRHAVDLQREAEPTPESPDNAPLVPGTHAASKPAFALARWHDAAGRMWQEIDLAELARLPQFLAVTG